MANISLDRQTFYNPSLAAVRKPPSQNRSPQNNDIYVASFGGQQRPHQDAHVNGHGSFGPSQAAVVLVSSDSESDPGDLDDVQSDTSFPPLGGFGPQHNVESSGIANTSLMNSASAGGSDMEQSSFTDLAAEDSQGSKPLISAVDGFNGLSPSRLAEPRRETAPSGKLQQPGTENATTSSLSLSLPRSTSPAPLHIDSSRTNGAEEPSEADLALQNSSTASDMDIWDSLTSPPNKDNVNLHRSGPQDSQSCYLLRDENPLSQASSVPLAKTDRGNLQAHRLSRQTSPLEDSTCGTTIARTPNTTPENAEVLQFLSSSHSLPIGPELESNDPQVNVPQHVLAENSSHDGKTAARLIKQKRSDKPAAARHGNRRLDNVFIAGHSSNKAGDRHKSTPRPPTHRHHQMGSQRKVVPGEQDGEDEDSCYPSQDSDSEPDDRPQRRKRRRISAPGSARKKGDKLQTNRKYIATGSPQVPTPESRSSQDCAEHSPPVQALCAKFAEWLLKVADVRSATVDGARIFQLRFEEDRYCPKHRRHVPTDSQLNSTPRSTASVTWAGGKSLSISQSHDDSQSSMSVDEEAEYEIEEIQGIRKRGRGSQVLVKWVGFTELTWEPLKQFYGTEALCTYQATHRGSMLALGTLI
ncbi:hypothetical protein PG993_010793 [Apiospora rasikravindrae]|uniref:Chromo domain-containing protein n=1 Tax=Apiospora rasikravindrae TaxID=990691 RepID=A0ABR1SEN5_9PEZI